MNTKAELLITSLGEVSERFGRPLTIVETGTIRNAGEQYAAGDGHSTRHIAEWIRDNSPDSMFSSIDLNTTVARQYLRDMKLSGYVSLISGDSLLHLKRFDTIDFCYLDSENDAELTFNEFMIVWDKVPGGGCIIVDDCNLRSTELLKGDKLIPYLAENNIPFEQVGNQIRITK